MRSKTVDLDRQFADGLKRARVGAGLTQEQLTQAMAGRGFGFYQATVYKIESGMRRVTVGEAIALAQILGTSVEALAGASGQAEESQRGSIYEEIERLQTTLDVVVHARREAEMRMAHSHQQLEELRAREDQLDREIRSLREIGVEFDAIRETEG